MLSVPTLWTVFVINFLALGLIWAYVMRSYPKFEAARFWTGSALAAAVGAALATLRFATDWDSLLPLLAGGTVLIFAACLAAMGVRRFYGHEVTWRGTALITALSCAGLAFFIFGYDSMPMRILIYSVGQSLPLALTLKLLLSRHHGRTNPGGRLAAIVAMLIIAIYALRAGASLLQLGGEISFVRFSPGQSALILMLVFLSMAWNFGFLLMAIDRLRNEDAAGCAGADVPISLSIGVAQWTGEIGPFPDRMMAAADHALYAAKNGGKNRYAVYDPAPPLAPDIDREPMRQPALRKHA